MWASRAVPAVLAAAAALALPAAAGAVPPERSTFSDPFHGGFSCAGFDGVYVGHDRGLVIDYFDKNGNPVMEVGHINSIETDTNLSTRKSVVIRTHLLVHMDFVTGTHSLSGAFNIGTFPGEGIVIHDAGRVTFDADGNPVDFHGIHDTFTKGPEAFCDALR